MLIDFFRQNDLVESVIQIGNKGKDINSDIDLILILYEESDIDTLILNLKSDYQVISHPSPNHIFLQVEGKIYDLYIVSSAFIHAFYSEQKMLFDKRGFIGTLIGEKTKISVEDHVYAICVLAKRIVGKIQQGKYIQATRLLSDIRDKHLICVYQYKGILAAENIINLNWCCDENNEYRVCYLKMFCPPIKEEIIEALHSLIDILQIVIGTSDQLLKELKEEVTNVENRLY